MHLPGNTVRSADLKLHYSLHKAEQEAEPLKSQIKNFKCWLMSPIQLDRAGGPSAHRTVDNILKVVHQFLGFRQLHKQADCLSLWDLLNMNDMAAYLSFQKARGNTIGTLTCQISGARKVLKFLQSQANTLAVKEQIDAASTWLSQLNRQLAIVMPKPVDTKELPTASTVVRMVEKLRQETLKLVPPPGQPMCPEFARALHDACLACCMFGYLPPVRLVCLRTLQLPGIRGCHYKGCCNTECQGNRLTWINDSSGRHLHIQLSHYKVEKRSDFLSQSICSSS